MKHFVLLLNYNMPKNSLQNALIDYLKERSNTIVDAQEFSKLLIFDIERLNDQYPRCKPLKCTVHGDAKVVSFSFSQEWTVGLYLYQVKTN